MAKVADVAAKKTVDLTELANIAGDIHGRILPDIAELRKLSDRGLTKRIQDDLTEAQELKLLTEDEANLIGQFMGRFSNKAQISPLQDHFFQFPDDVVNGAVSIGRARGD
jgi:hypothetical protein